MLSIRFTGATDGEDGPFDLVNTADWVSFVAWAETLPAADYPLVRALAADGTAAPTYLLAEQLAAAVEASPPAGGARAAADRIAKAMGIGDPEETAVIGGVS
jgi:hypothetical protein